MADSTRRLQPFRIATKRTFPTEVLVTRQNTFDVVKMSSLKWAAHVCFFIQTQTSTGPKMSHSQILQGKQVQSHTKSICVYVTHWHLLTFSLQRNIHGIQGPFVFVFDAFLIHISTPSFQNSSCSGLIFNDFDDFNDDLLIQTFFS